VRLSWPILHYLSKYLEKLRKHTKDVHQDSQPSGRESDPGPLKYDAGVYVVHHNSQSNLARRSLPFNTGVSSSNLVQDTGYPYWESWLFSAVLPRK